MACGARRAAARRRGLRALAREVLGAPEREAYGGVLGTFCAAACCRPRSTASCSTPSPGEVSDPIETPAGFHVLQRVERDAACARSSSRATGRLAERCEKLLERLREGEDFAPLARERLATTARAPRAAAQLAIFERGAAGPAAQGGRLPRQGGRDGAARSRARSACTSSPRAARRGRSDARRRRRGARARDPDRLRRRPPASIRSSRAATRRPSARGRDRRRASAAARTWPSSRARYDDDPGGRERAGDLGWIRRRTRACRRSWTRPSCAPPAQVLGPLPDQRGLGDPAPRALTRGAEAAAPARRWSRS